MKNRVSFGLSASALLALAACADPGAYDTPSRAKQGAIAGAVVGGLIGAGESRDRAILGAVIGGTAGAVAGDVLDRQAAQIRASVSSPGVEVVNRGSHVQVVMPENVLFATDSAAVSGAAVADLYAVARSLQTYPSRVAVIGHTDNTGSAAHNQRLSERRAESVAGVLVQGGVAPQQIRTMGRGYAEPVASNDTPFGRAQNRRVEILLTPY